MDTSEDGATPPIDGRVDAQGAPEPAPTSRTGWAQRAAALTIEGRAFVDGRWTAAADGASFASVDPATGAVLAQVAAGDAADVDRAVVAARRAFERGDWSRADPADRRVTLLALADLIERHAVELALLESLDMGKLVAEAADYDVPAAAAVVRWYAEAIDKLYGEVAPTPPGELAFVTRVPLGVVGAVVPWNYPLLMAVWKLAPALATGNSVVLKPAEQSPLSALRLAALAAEAGLPDGVLNVVPGLGETAGAALGRHPDVDAIAFTGSTEVGKLFLGYAGASNMKQVWLECGGKSPNLVFADAPDLDAVADAACGGIFENQGEVCSAHSRLLVDRRILEPLLERLVDRAAALRPGDPLDPASTLGALVDETHARRVLGHIERARAGDEARLVLGGERVTVDGAGCFVEPTIFVGDDPAAPIAQEEIFGPVLLVLPFDDEDEAVRIANGTRYGLAASLWTADLSRAHRVAGRLRAGTVSVNAVDASALQVPFGGFGQSGFGRDLSLHALDKYTGTKTTWIHYEHEETT